MNSSWFQLGPPPLACFSPPVMISTFTLEITFAVLTAIRFPRSLFRDLVITVLICLSSFQIAEFEVCQGPPSSALAWTKLGLVGISFLPAMGMHLISLLTRWNPIVWLGYLLAIAYAAIFLFVPGATGPAECQGNYILLDIQQGFVGRVYDGYYTGFLALAMIQLALRLAQPAPANDPKHSPRLIALMLVGYLSFIVPMAVVALVSSHLRQATPSIMCGFALFLAFILALWIAPTYARERMAFRAR